MCIRDRVSPQATEGACSSPDPHALVGCEVELVALLDPERVVPGVEVAHGQRAIVARRVRVDSEARAQRRLAHLGRPRLRIGDEEALVAGEPANLRRGLAAERLSLIHISEPTRLLSISY